MLDKKNEPVEVGDKVSFWINNLKREGTVTAIYSAICHIRCSDGVTHKMAPRDVTVVTKKEKEGGGG